MAELFDYERHVTEFSKPRVRLVGDRIAYQTVRVAGFLDADVRDDRIKQPVNSILATVHQQDVGTIVESE